MSNDDLPSRYRQVYFDSSTYSFDYNIYCYIPFDSHSLWLQSEIVSSHVTMDRQSPSAKIPKLVPAWVRTQAGFQAISALIFELYGIQAQL